jgi:hypothetical protein
MPEDTSIQVTITRRTRDGWYIYTCDQLPGLFVASPDNCAAYADLPYVIATLLKADHGIECVVEIK